MTSQAKIALDPNIRAWHRQLAEDPLHYDMFQFFLLTRSTPAVRDKYMPSETNGIVLVNNLCNAKRWRDRARHYDNWLIASKDDAIKHLVENETKEIAKNRIRLIRSLYNEIRKVGNMIKADVRPTARAVGSYAKLIRMWDDIARRMEADNGVAVGAGIKTPGAEAAKTSHSALKEMMDEIVSKSVPPGSKEVPLQ